MKFTWQFRRFFSGAARILLAGIDLAKAGFKVIEHTPTARVTHIVLSKS